MLLMFNPIDIEDNIIFQFKLSIQLRQIRNRIIIQYLITKPLSPNIQKQNPLPKLIKLIKNRNLINNSKLNPL